MPDSVAFALPTVSSADMSRDDQGALIVNQATAVIVAAWLEHATALTLSDTAGLTDLTVSQQQLVTVVNDVQDALRAF